MPTLSGRRNPGTERTPDDGRTTAADPPHYPPREDSFLLLPFTVVPAGTSLLDIGTGSGFLALAAARHGARVVATDLNPHALRRVAEVARREGLNPQLVRTDLARGLGRFDRIVANPPYLPTRPEQRDPERWHNLALDGGPDGCATTARLVATLADHMAPDGPGLRPHVVPPVGDPAARDLGLLEVQGRDGGSGRPTRPGGREAGGLPARATAPAAG